MRNSFRQDNVYRMFLQMMYQLLISQNHPFSAKKIICWGASDSGKTTWLVPIQEVVDPTKVATITREKKFAAQMVKPDTQLIFVDEMTAENLPLDEAKVIFQGGSQFIPQKHGLCAYVQYRSGAYMTCNTVRINLTNVLNINFVEVRPSLIIHLLCLETRFWNFR